MTDAPPPPDRAPDHAFPWRVDYADTDAGGVVYHSRYIDWAERARMQWVRDLGLSNRDLLNDDHVAFAVRKLAADYRAPGRFDDLLEIRTWLMGVGGASFTVRQDICRPAPDSDADAGADAGADTAGGGLKAVTLVSLDLVLVCMKVAGPGAGKAARLPQALRDAVAGS
jgi:acyl-CoA thioester hydrolase